MRQAGVTQLYRHQEEAVDHALSGRDVLITTPTSSGKSLCYNVPVFQACLTEPMARALYLFPTKALAHDQLEKLESTVPGGELRFAPYDGDTARAMRSLARREAHVLLTNPDMLHVGMLPNHEPWSKFLKALRYIVVDELHTYRGLFGTHVAGVLRRLTRLAAWHGAKPQIIACSATVAEPLEFYERLTGREAALVSEDTGPAGHHRLVTVGSLAEGEGTRPNRDAAELLARLAAADRRTMVFCQSRAAVERVLGTARSLLEDKGHDPLVVDSYRGGYTASERRSIEKSLAKGKLLGLATTNAMELGIDVGSLDVVVLNGYPGTVSSFWQQSGRAGRSGRDGTTVYIAHADALEQLLAREPYQLNGVGDPCVLGLENPTLVGAQLKCAAYERAVDPAELYSFAPCAQSTADQLVDEGVFSLSAGKYYYPSHTSPAREAHLRGEPGRQVSLMCGDRLVGSMEPWRAVMGAHPGAVYLHRGETFVVEELDPDAREARMVSCEPDYSTEPVTSTAVEPHTVLLGEPPLRLVGMSVTTSVTGYRKLAADSGAVLSEEELVLPSRTLDTVGLRIDPDLVVDGDDTTALSVVHSLEHVFAAVAPMVAGCDRRDLLTTWYGVFPDNFKPAVFIADGVQGGVGFSERMFVRFDLMVDFARHLLESCPCPEGCPSCLLSSRCEAGNTHLAKPETLQFLTRGLGDLKGILRPR